MFEKFIINDLFSFISGEWLAEDEEYEMSDVQKRRIDRTIMYSKRVFMNWEVIVQNLTCPAMWEVEPRLFTLRNLYDSVDEAWIIKEKKRLRLRFQYLRLQL